MRRQITARFVNGVLAAIITVAFLVHALIGETSSFTGGANALAWLIWGVVALAGAHVVASIVTSHGQLTDSERPPSTRKKRHLALKWATGIALAIAVVAHIACVRTFGPDAARVNALATAVTLLLLAALAAHVWVGAKSLMTDLELSKKLVPPFRAVLCVLVCALGCAVIAGIVWRI